MPRNVKAGELKGSPERLDSHPDSSPREVPEALVSSLSCRQRRCDPALERMLFTASEVADSLAISESLVRQLTLMNSLPCRRIGRLVRYSPADVGAFISALDERSYTGRPVAR